MLTVVAAVLAFVYLIVTPSLEDRLIGSRQDQVAGIVDEVAGRWPPPPSLSPDQLAASYAAATNTRVRIFRVDNRAPLSLSAITDKGGGPSVLATDSDPVALKAATTLDSERGVVTLGDRRFAEAAQPSSDGKYVFLVSNSIEDSLGSVELVKHRLFISALFALAAALLLGYAGARLFARRIRRLERAAERIANQTLL